MHNMTLVFSFLQQSEGVSLLGIGELPAWVIPTLIY